MNNNKNIKEKDLEEKIKDLKNKIEEFYKDKAKIDFSSNVLRGHVWPVAYEFEDRFTNILSEIFKDKDYCFYTDFSLEKRRPDIIITKKNKVVAMIELKANLGWCRDWDYNKDEKTLKDEIKEKLELLKGNENSTSIINCTRKVKDLYENRDLIKDEIQKEEIIEKYNKGTRDHTIKREIENNKNLKFALIALTSDNIPTNKLEKFEGKFKSTFKGNEGKFICLFNGWYNDLKKNEGQIKLLLEFINSIE